MKRPSLVILLMASSILSAQASWNGDNDTGANNDAPRGQVHRVDPGHLRYHYVEGTADRIEVQVEHDANDLRNANYVNDGEIQGHVGNNVIHVEPFAIRGQPEGNYDGQYGFVRDLTGNSRIKGRENGRLIYSDGQKLYLPHVTQEEWKRDDDTRVAFVIASIKDDRRFKLIPGANSGEQL